MTQRHNWGWSNHLTSVKNNKKCGPRHMLRQIRMTAVKNNDYRPRSSVVIVPEDFHRDAVFVVQL